MSLSEPSELVTGLPVLSTPTEIFPPSVKAAFLVTIQAKGYINRERFSYTKYIYLQVFLDDTGLRANDQVDCKIKYKAFHDYELYDNGSGKKLYRLPSQNHIQ